jgi:hypothetical protein
MGVYLHVGRDIMNAVDRQLTSHEAWDGWKARFLKYACAMIKAELPHVRID